MLLQSLQTLVGCTWLMLVSKTAGFSVTKTNALVQKARNLLHQKDADAAFSILLDVYANDPHYPGLNALFKSYFKLQIDTQVDSTESRFGLTSLYLDQERYAEAGQQLLLVLNTLNATYATDERVREKATWQLMRVNSAMCEWNTAVSLSSRLRETLKLEERMACDDPTNVPAVHPFDALKWPCISLPECTKIAYLYARRAMASQGLQAPSLDAMLARNRSRVILSATKTAPTIIPRPKQVRLGYISPDLTATHPMAFLIQSVFQHHNRNVFNVTVFSLASKLDDCPEVAAIRNGSDQFVLLSLGDSPASLAAQINDYNIDILIDLCGFTGTSAVAEILSHRPARLQISYMGFPGSMGAPFIDYLIADSIVVPDHLRSHYTESVVYMPHCYFVNSHASCVKNNNAADNNAERLLLRRLYNLPEDAFVFCSHNRPDKMDVTTTRMWLEALRELRMRGVKAILWMLRSGKEMERNLRLLGNEYGVSDALVFSDVTQRNEHLRRLTCADVFLDTPSYNAHTVGCDTLYAGVPIITLLRLPAGLDGIEVNLCPTDKLPSRVGASLLTAAGLEELISQDIDTYKQLMIRSATDREWFPTITKRLLNAKRSSPLFNTPRWVKNLEIALQHVAKLSASESNQDYCDIIIQDDDSNISLLT
jgi:protein O-GlcNAc transferase